MLMQVLADSGDKTGSEQIGLAFISRNKTESIVYDVLARQYLRSRRANEAIQVLLKQVDANPGSERALLQLATYYLLAGQAPHVAEALAPLADVKQFPNGRLAAGEFYEHSGMPEEAYLQYEAGAAIKGNVALPYRKRQIAIRIAQRRFDEARQLLLGVLKEQPQDRELLRSRALLLSEGEGKRDEAIQEWRALTQSDAQDSIAHFHLGTLLMRSGDLAGSETELNAALRIDPGSTQVMLARVSASLARLDYSQALQRSDALLESHPANEGGRLTRVAALRGLGRFSEARAALAELKESAKNGSAIELESGYLLIAEGKLSQAESHISKAVSDRWR